MMHFTPDPGWHNDPIPDNRESRNETNRFAIAKTDIAVIRALQQGYRYVTAISQVAGLTDEDALASLSGLVDAGVVKRTEAPPYRWTLT